MVAYRSSSERGNVADYNHLTNLIQGEVIRIRERRPLLSQEELLEELIRYLKDQAQEVTITKLKVKQEISDLLDKH